MFFFNVESAIEYLVKSSITHDLVDQPQALEATAFRL